MPIHPNSASCFLHLYNQTGSPTIELDYNEDDNNIEWNLTINGGNFTTVGLYSFIIQCNSTTQGGFVSSTFEVIDTENNTTTLQFWQIFFGYFIIIIALLFLMHTFKKEITTVIVYGTIAGTINLIYIGYLLTTINIVAFNLTWIIIALIVAMTLYFFLVGATFRRDYKDKLKEDD